MLTAKISNLCPKFFKALVAKKAGMAQSSNNESDEWLCLKSFIVTGDATIYSITYKTYKLAKHRTIISLWQLRICEIFIYMLSSNYSAHKLLGFITYVNKTAIQNVTMLLISF